MAQPSDMLTLAVARTKSLLQVHTNSHLTYQGSFQKKTRAPGFPGANLTHRQKGAPEKGGGEPSCERLGWKGAGACLRTAFKSESKPLEYFAAHFCRDAPGLQIDKKPE